MESGNKNSWFLPVSIILAAILISVSIIYVAGGGGQPSDQSEEPSDSVAEISPRDVILGDPDAPVSVIEYSDFQCPYCGLFYKNVSIPLREDYVKSGEVKVVARTFSFLGVESFKAAEAAECAKDQGEFWNYHDLLYDAESVDGRENNGNLNRDLFISLADQLDLNRDEFISCIDSNKYANQVQQDSNEARQSGIKGTPTVFLNGQQISGTQLYDYASFSSLIDNILANEGGGE